MMRTTTCGSSQQDYGWQVRNDLRHAHRRAAARLHRVRSRRAARALLRREARQEASARRLVDASAHATECSTTPRRTRASCSSSRTSWRRSWSGRAARRGRARSSRSSKERAGGRGRPGWRFLRVKGARDLSRRELAVLRELVPWRDAVAGSLDRATFRVLGNEQLLDIARTQPRTKEALSKVKGMPRAVLEQRGEELLDAVARALAVPEADLPKFPRAARWDRDPEFDARVQRTQDGARRCRQATAARSRRALLTRSTRSGRAAKSGDGRGSRRSERAASMAGGRAARRRSSKRSRRTARREEGGRADRSRVPCTPAPSARSGPATRRASTPG